MGRGTTDRETKILLDELCPECKGEGCFYSEAWAEFNKAWDAAKARATEEHEKDTGATSRPFAWVNERTEQLLKERGVTEPEGPEEPDCPTCEGSGRSKRYVALAELGDMIEAAKAAGRK